MAKSPEEEHPIKVVGWAARDASGVIAPLKFSRRATGEKDVQFKVLYCRVCHNDLHSVKNDWGNATFPLIPGHEIVRVGDRVSVGCLVGSCRSCHNCGNDEENYCPKLIFTYNSTDSDGTTTYGGYSDVMVVDEHFTVHIPKSLPLNAAAPLLCARITVYSPLKFFGLDKPGLHVGVVGLGGLGHVAVKFAKAMGAKVTVISTSPRKKTEAIERLGADEFLFSSNNAQIKAAIGTSDGIIDTVSAMHLVTQLLGLLKNNGKLIFVGLPQKPLEVHAFSVVGGRKTLAGSAMGGIKETQEMLDFAAKHNITADIELIKFDYLNEAMARLAKADVKYQFVIDVAHSIGSASL